jgi:predicted ATPase
MLFIAVNQINNAGTSAVLETTELAAMARYNLLAAKSAIYRSDFSSAYYFTSHGMTFLQSSHTNHWDVQYHLSLELFELASKSAFATGNIQNHQVLSGEVLKHARCFEDKLNVYYTILTSLVQSAKVSEALDTNCRILAQLGEVIPNEISKELLNKHIQQTQAMIRGISESDLLNYRLMTDNRLLATLKYLARLEFMALLVKPTLHSYITLRMVQLTLLHGEQLLSFSAKVHQSQLFHLIILRLLSKD